MCVCWPWPWLVIIDNIVSMCVYVLPLASVGYYVCLCVCFGLDFGWFDNRLCVCVCWPWPRLVIIDNIASTCVCVCFGLGLGWVGNILCVCVCIDLGLGWLLLTI